MEMSVDNAVLSVVLKGIGHIKSLLEDTKEIENNLAEIDLDCNDTNSWKVPKNFIDNLFNQVSQLKEDFYVKYELLAKHPENVKEIPNSPVGDKDVLVDHNYKNLENYIVSPPIETPVGVEESVSTETEDNVQHESDKNIEKSTKGDERNSKESDKDGITLDETEKTTDEKDECNEEEESVIESDNPDVIDTSIQNDVLNFKSKIKEEDVSSKNDTEGGGNGKPFLRLVSLSKLIDPNVKKSIESTPSILIISSSDEENPVANGGLKSTSNTLSKKQTHKTEKPPNRDQLSQKSKQKDFLEISDSDEESLVGNKKTKELNDSCSRSEISGRKKNLKHKKSKRNDSCNECSDIETDHNRKSSRLKKSHISRVERIEKFKKIFKRNSSKKEFDSEDESDNTTRKSKKNMRISVSDEDSDLEKEQQSQKYRNDKKFKYDVYIPLPSIKCEDLKSVSENQKELLEIKKLTNLTSLKKRIKKSDSESNSSVEGSTKHVSKKARKTKKAQRNKFVSNSENSGDDETHNDAASNEDCPAVDNNTILADIAVEKMRSSDEDNIENNDQEVHKCEKLKSPNKEAIEKDTGSNGSVEENSTTGDKANVDKNSNSLNKDDSDKDKENKNKNKEKENVSDGSECDKSKKWKKGKLLTEKLDNTDSDEKTSKNKARADIIRETRKKMKSANISSDSDKSDSDRETVGKDKQDRKMNRKKITVSSDSDNDLNKSIEIKDSSSDNDSDNRRKDKLKAKKPNRKKIKKVISDSEDEFQKPKDDTDKSSNSETSSSDNNSDEKKEEEPKSKRRRRIKNANKSSSDESDDKSTRKNIRKLIDRDSLSAKTKQAEAAEKERKARIAEKQKKYNQILEQRKESKVETVILEYDEKKKEDLVPVHKHFLEKLKPHQASGIRFMWDACFESLEMIKKGKGGGCILAHCMGLGKTLQVIALAHTLLSNSEKTKVEKILVVCPVSTVLNWKAEFKLWMPKRNDIEVFELVSCKNYERQYRVKEWIESGGVLIIGYTMFTLLTNPNNKKINKKTKTTFYEGLVDPGPDLVVCDEGHLLKNEKTNLSIAMNRIKTNRRIVLTGTPLQNNMKEYWCMVQFIKPNLLGTYKEYLNRFVNPITNGQYTDSTKHDIDLMRKRSHVLHKLLDGVVQRRDYSVLAPYLPPKHEYVVFIKLTEMQIKIYKEYVEKYARKNNGSNRTSYLFKDFQFLQRIAIHPRALLYKSKEKEDDEEEEESEGSLKDFIDDADASNKSKSSSSDSESGSDSSGKNKYQQKQRVTRAQAAYKKDNNIDGSDSDVEILSKKEWWQEHCTDEELENINNSGKLFLLFEILKSCEEIGDKILVFSQSLFTLDCIEYFLEKIDEATQNGTSEQVGGHSGSWSLGLDYFRLDGSSSCDNRANWCNMFNDPNNTRARLFLISTRAGGLGINLVAANRVIIFDVSWNPSHDIQSIYRVYRFGQVKPSYIYRFVTHGGMEMKIYERQVTKQAISKRVIDEQQIDRHYNQNDLQELYKCDLDPEERPIPLVPKDVLLGEMLQKYDKTIYKYHEHHSLLENKESEELNEEERKAAWEEFENEKVIRKSYTTNLPNLGNSANTIAEALASIVRRDNPTWSEIQIRGIIPALVKQLQMQLAEGDTSMFTRVQREILIMQRTIQQQMAAGYYNMFQLNQNIQQQHSNNSRLGNLAVNPAAFMPGNWPLQHQAYINNSDQIPGPSNRQIFPTNPNDVIDLND